MTEKKDISPDAKRKFHTMYDLFDAQNGTGDSFLLEPVPDYSKRSGDVVINSKEMKQGCDNNAQIILGRDRAPFGKRSRESISKSGVSSSKVSGYSDYMAAGSIDIVVGKGAPYPIKNPDIESGPANYPPHYTTRTPPDLKMVELLPGLYHPGYVMDAARIYISQMCDVDEYFKMAGPDSADISPCSAIVLKSDRVRIHSRRDIKIQAGGDIGPKFDSKGYQIKEYGKIHLIAGDGVWRQQPIPLGNNLVKFLAEVLDTIDDVLEVVNNFAMSQKMLNQSLSNQVFGTAVGPTTSNPISQTQNVIKQISDMKDMISISGAKLNNIPSLRIAFLERTGEFYVNSRNVTTN